MQESSQHEVVGDTSSSKTTDAATSRIVGEPLTLTVAFAHRQGQGQRGSWLRQRASRTTGLKIVLWSCVESHGSHERAGPQRSKLWVGHDSVDDDAATGHGDQL